MPKNVKREPLSFLKSNYLQIIKKIKGTFEDKKIQESLTIPKDKLKRDTPVLQMHEKVSG